MHFKCVNIYIPYWLCSFCCIKQVLYLEEKVKQNDSLYFSPPEEMSQITEDKYKSG